MNGVVLGGPAVAAWLAYLSSQNQVLTSGTRWRSRAAVRALRVTASALCGGSVAVAAPHVGWWPAVFQCVSALMLASMLIPLGVVGWRRSRHVG